MNCLLSIITVNLNNRVGLQKTAESVVSQDLTNCEWIIIDGASTDGSQEIFLQYKKYISYCISEKDTGIYEAMNKGVAQCHGEYCLFLNSGDSFFSSNVIADNMEQLLAFQDRDIIRFGVAETLNGKIINFKYPCEKITGFYLFTNSIAHQATLIKTVLLRKYPYQTQYRIIADGDFFTHIYLYENIKDIAFHNILTNYDCSGISSTHTWLSVQERKQSFLTQTSPLIYEDYYRFAYGGNLLEKWICKLKNNLFFYWCCVIVLLPLYIFYCLKSLICNFSFFYTKYIKKNFSQISNR